MRKLKPETRRAIIEVSARENLGFQDAMEHLIHEGVKAVHNPVEKQQDNQGEKL